jgi:hypothetical protein
MSTDAQAEAIKTLLATATKAPVYDHDEAQALGTTAPAQYTVIYLSRRFGGNVRGETRENDLRRLQTRVHAKTVSNARLLEDRIAEAFAHTTHTIGGVLTHFAYETGGGVYAYDTGYYTDLTDWTFTV